MATRRKGTSSAKRANVSKKKSASARSRASRANGGARRLQTGAKASNGKAPRTQQQPARGQEGKDKEAAAATTRRNPLTGLRQEIDRIFDDFSAGLPRLPFGRRADAEPLRRFQAAVGLAVPAVDLVEKDREFQITAELPGLDEDDVEVLVSGGVLTIRGRKREQRDERRGETYVSERRYGSFQRCFQMPADVNPDRIQATFHKGVLAISLPKVSQTPKTQRKIAIRAR
jgi:HSP20 family protein